MTEGENSARRTARDRKQSRKEKIKVNIVRKVTGRDFVNSMCTDFSRGNNSGNFIERLLCGFGRVLQACKVE
jgi:hypothetical protein